MNTIKEGKINKGGRNDPPTTARPTKPKGQQPNYPECEKLAEVSPQSNVVGEFLDWLSNEKNLTICTYTEDEDPMVLGDCSSYYPYHYDTEQLLAEFFEIDLKKVEEERRQILEDIRKSNETNPI